MSKKLPLAHKDELCELHYDYRQHSETLRKEAKIEGYGKVAGIAGVLLLIAEFLGIIDDAGISSVVLTLAFIAVIFGAWAFFSPPSADLNRTEALVLNMIGERLQELGYHPYFVKQSVSFIKSDEWLNVYRDTSYEIAANEQPLMQSQQEFHTPVSTPSSSKKYKVLVDDNFNYMDEDERYVLGEYASKEEAVTACKQVVDTFLRQNLSASTTEEELYEKWFSFGEDPWFQGGDFSARKYAEIRSKEIIDGLKQLG